MTFYYFINKNNSFFEIIFKWGMNVVQEKWKKMNYQK